MSSRQPKKKVLYKDSPTHKRIQKAVGILRAKLAKDTSCPVNCGHDDSSWCEAEDPSIKKKATKTMNPLQVIWHTDRIQFPRLLAEIRAVGLTAAQYRMLRESMDLTDKRIDELFARAELEWEFIKGSLA